MSWNSYDLFGEREQPPMSAELFATVVLARLRPVAGIILQARQGLEFQLVVRGQPTVVHLDSYYRRYRADPAQLTPLIQEFVEQVERGEAEAASPDSFEQIAPRLLPLLINTAQWQAKREAGARLVVRPLVQDLGIALVIDEPDAITYVQLEAIPRWGIDIVSAYDTALSNLAERARDAPVSRLGAGVETLLIDRAQDGYAATRAILPERLADWSRRVQGELVLGLPTRNFMIGMSRAHPALEALGAQVEKDAQNDEDGLLPQLLVYRDGVLQILT